MKKEAVFHLNLDNKKLSFIWTNGSGLSFEAEQRKKGVIL